MNSPQFVLTILTLLAEGVDLTRCDGDCTRSRVFRRKAEDAVLRNHVISEHLVASEIECGHLCMRESRCVSFNYQAHGEALPHLCEISDDKQDGDPGNMLSMDGFSYYEPEPDLPHMGTTVSCCRRAESCLSLKGRGETADGLHHIDVPNVGLVQVFCDQQTDGGGWTLIQRRISKFSLVFDRSWSEYENGFGNLTREFWLGNKIIHELTKTPREVRIELKSRENVSGYAVYTHFTVAGPRDKYRLEISGYNGDIGDCGAPSSGRYFMTNDCKKNVCAARELNGWWYNKRGCGNLNRKDRPIWHSWKTANDDIIFSEMKIR